MLIRDLSLIVIIAPLIGAIIAGIFGKQIAKKGAHWITISCIAIAFVLSLYVFTQIIFYNASPFNGTIYTWAASGSFYFNVGLLIDRLTAVMMVTVTFVSLLVHIYSIGYMADDPGYQRFFAYMSLFTFAMLTLVTANNFLLLFFGWEGVGLVSYLLIGFWYTKESAAHGSFKAFIVNRIGDFGFILGIAAILDYFGTIDYAAVFATAPYHLTTTIQILPHTSWSIITVICLLLFIGAMGKSAQMPLHIWLPESMEGPTPISALIHAATMVTAGVYMVARMSPLFELSTVALSTVLIIGATGALFMGLVGLVQTDIKRVIAYSTMSQLGYMMAANGASAFSAGIFHLVTHASFKALLFLAAGSIIVAMHHEQDLRKMGNLKKYMPITYFTFLIGALALAAIPPFAGFYSKDAIIEAVRHSSTPGAIYAYTCLLLGAFVTALYIFRAFFLAFHGEERIEEKVKAHLHESSSVITIPLIILAIPSLFLGLILATPFLYHGLLGNAVYTLPAHLANILNEDHGVWLTAVSAIFNLPFWFSVMGIVTAWICYVVFPQLPEYLSKQFALIYKFLVNKYGFDALIDLVFVRGGRALSNFFYKYTDVKFIDDILVNGSGRSISRISQLVRRLQSGHLYHYVFAMIIGLFAFLSLLFLHNYF